MNSKWAFLGLVLAASAPTFADGAGDQVTTGVGESDIVYTPVEIAACVAGTSDAAAQALNVAHARAVEGCGEQSMSFVEIDNAQPSWIILPHDSQSASCRAQVNVRCIND